MALLNREQISKALKDRKLKFNELDSRMNYGLIGQLLHNDKVVVLIFPNNFYVRDIEFPINTTHLLIIQSIQEEFVELTRDKKRKNSNIQKPRR